MTKAEESRARTQQNHISVSFRSFNSSTFDKIITTHATHGVIACSLTFGKVLVAADYIFGASCSEPCFSAESHVSSLQVALLIILGGRDPVREVPDLPHDSSKNASMFQEWIRFKAITPQVFLVDTCFQYV